MSFLHPQLLWLLAIPALLLLRELAHRNATRRAPAGKILTADAGPAGVTLSSASHATRTRVRWRLALGLALATLAVARPQYGRIEEPVFDQAREIIVAIDLSRSMLADDVKPNRLDRACLLTQSLLENTPGERVGLVVFSGTAFLQSPLSGDHEIIRDFLPLLDPGFLPAGGTDYRALLQTALDAFSDSAADRFLIVLSDGEAARDDWRELIPQARERDIRILTLGIGTTDGAMLPDGQGGLIKDERGAVVLSRLDATTLRDLARETDGVYTDASNWVDLPALIDTTVARGRRGEFQESGRARLAERYQWALAPALLLLLWSFWREFPVRIDSAPVGRLRTAAKTAALLLLLHSALGIEQSSFAAEGAPPSLPELAAQLSVKPELNAADYASFVRATLAHGQEQRAQNQPTPAGILDDGLAATAAGRRLDPAAADWDQLQTALEALRQPPPPPPPSEKPSPESKPDKPGEKSDDDSDQADQSGQPSDKSEDASKGDPADQDSAKPDPADSSANESAPDSNSSSDPTNPAEDPAQQKPGQSAFGDMTSEESPPESAQPEPSPGDPAEPEPAPAPGETQRVGGQPDGSQPATTDPELLKTLQRLEQLKTRDSPARLFQLLQDPNDQPPAPAGQTW